MPDRASLHHIAQLWRDQAQALWWHQQGQERTYEQVLDRIPNDPVEIWGWTFFATLIASSGRSIAGAGGIQGVWQIPRDPLALARVRLGPRLTDSDQALLVLDLLSGGDPTEGSETVDRDGVAALAELLHRHPDISALELGLAFCLGWPGPSNQATPSAAPIAEAAMRFLVNYLFGRALSFMAAKKVPGGLRIDPSCQLPFAAILARTLIDSTCECHHHGGAGKRRCRETHAEVGSRCGVPCCLHRLVTWRPEERPLLEDFVAKALAGRLGRTLSSDELVKGLVVRTLVDRSAGSDGYPKFLHRGVPETVQIRSGTVAFKECRRECFQDYPVGRLCPQGHESRPDDPMVDGASLCQHLCKVVYHGRKTCRWGHGHRDDNPSFSREWFICSRCNRKYPAGAARCPEYHLHNPENHRRSETLHVCRAVCREPIGDTLRCPRLHLHCEGRDQLLVLGRRWRCRAECGSRYEEGAACSADHDPTDPFRWFLVANWVFVESVPGYFEYLPYHLAGASAWLGHPVSLGPPLQCQRCPQRVGAGDVVWVKARPRAVNPEFVGAKDDSEP